MAAGKLIWVKRIYQQAGFLGMIVVFLVNLKNMEKLNLAEDQGGGMVRML
jgi:hypothetical protein